MCRSHLAPIFVLAALPLAASAELVQSGVCVGELYGLSSNPDGVVHDNEYGSDPFTGYGTGAGSLLSRPIQVQLTARSCSICDRVRARSPSR